MVLYYTGGDEMLKQKKILCIFIAIMLLFTLSACGKSKTGTNSENTGTKTTSASNSADSNNSTSDTSNAASEGNVTDVLSKFASVDNYTYSATSLLEGQDAIKFKTAVKGNKMKFETTTNGITSAIYYDLDEKVMYTYDPETKAAMKMEFPGEDTVKASDLQYNFHKTDYTGANKTGTEKIAGKDCVVYEYVFGTQKTKIWVWEEYGILLRVASYEGDKLTNDTTFDVYEIGNVTDEMVTLPKGAQITELKL
jgi:outer membrane lipoprotein-sorting protein